MSEVSNASYQLRMPFLLTVALGVFAAVTVWSLWLLVSMTIGSFSFDINGQPADPANLIRRLAAPLGILCLVSGGVVYALRFERSWSRMLILFWWLVALVVEWVFFEATSPGSFTVAAAANPVLGLLGSVAYLYVKKSVRNYYSAIAVGKFHAEPSSTT